MPKLEICRKYFLDKNSQKQPLCKVARIIKSCENFTLEFETFTEVHLSTTIIFDHIKSETNKRKVEIANEEFIIGQ